MGKVDKIIYKDSRINLGTYGGGIVGINNGEISNCTNSSVTTQGTSYIGGITGMNIGIITGSNKIDSSIIAIANSYGGFVAGYNKGTIDGVNISSTQATGFTGGLNGLTGVNEGTITSNNYVEGEQYTGN